MSWTIHCNRCGHAASLLVDAPEEPGVLEAALPGWQLDRERDYDLCPACAEPEPD